jgi:predicted GTPase
MDNPEALDTQGTRRRQQVQHNTEKFKYEQHGQHQRQQPLVLY